MLDDTPRVSIGWARMIVQPLVMLLGLTVWLESPRRKFQSRGQCSHCGHRRDTTGRYCRACARRYHRLRRGYAKGQGIA